MTFEQFLAVVSVFKPSGIRPEYDESECSMADDCYRAQADRLSVREEEFSDPRLGDYINNKKVNPSPAPVAFTAGKS
jgi:hypothetical protein